MTLPSWMYIMEANMNIMKSGMQLKATETYGKMPMSVRRIRKPSINRFMNSVKDDKKQEEKTEEKIVEETINNCNEEPDINKDSDTIKKEAQDIMESVKEAYDDMVKDAKEEEVKEDIKKNVEDVITESVTKAAEENQKPDDELERVEGEIVEVPQKPMQKMEVDVKVKGNKVDINADVYMTKKQFENIGDVKKLCNDIYTSIVNGMETWIPYVIFPYNENMYNDKQKEEMSVKFDETIFNSLKSVVEPLKEKGLNLENIDDIQKIVGEDTMVSIVQAAIHANPSKVPNSTPKATPVQPGPKPLDLSKNVKKENPKKESKIRLIRYEGDVENEDVLPTPTPIDQLDPVETTNETRVNDESPKVTPINQLDPTPAPSKETINNNKQKRSKRYTKGGNKTKAIDGSEVDPYAKKNINKEETVKL
ncbi:MAG: hypothetical protein PHC62_00640 [Candidatus Izemoplasmatales bacterium]|nr:hypothetical protein [Candidatus Izemoplasmatales bacterium]